MTTQPKPYKETLCLPVTRLEMKANLAQNEPAIQARWQEMDLYGLIRVARKGRPRRVLHDGPPYANGDIHMGHLLNKVLKDIVVRYSTMRGFDAPYVPGWDCHGLPIEHKVVKDLGSKASSLGAAEIRARCHKEALHWVDVQRKQFERLGISADWSKPYLTLDHRYEAAVLDVLADLVERGLVFRQLKPIHWDIHDRTALAEAELEYHDHTSPSVYVTFPITRGAPDVLGPGPWRLMIWTTTPWTLPANAAIAAHPEVEYLGLRVTDPSSGEVSHLIIAAPLAEKVLSFRSITEWSAVARFSGRALENSTYRHVFVDRESPVVLADYVTISDGTGLVHTAPGHGADDYRTGQKYGLPTLSPVDESGRFVDDGMIPAELVDLPVFAANARIIEILSEAGALFHSAPITHSYPHGWRSKKPVIFRATAQWFIGVDREGLRDDALAAIRDSVQWFPAWGRNRIESMVSLRPDWCISRQRAWGVPIPVLHDTVTDYHHLTPESIRFHRDLFTREGADAWYQKPVAELVPPDLDTRRFPIENLQKGTDILDVWFESGSSHRAVLENPYYDSGPYPCHMYLEGSDQHRGWFQSSLLTAVGSTGQAPFQTVLTHGFVVDEKGEKMSKSVGNVIHAVKATEQFGADVLRLYVAAMDYSDDVRMSERGIKEASESYRKIRNTFRFLLGNLEDYAGFDPASVDRATLHPIDRWALSQLNRVLRDVTVAYDAHEFYRAYQMIYQFCSVDLSSFYLDVLKDRLYAESPLGAPRRAAQFVLARLHNTLARMLAPILTHTSEELWDFVPSGGDQKVASVHLADWPTPDVFFDDPGIAQRFDELRRVREVVLACLEVERQNKVIGSSLEASVELCAPPVDAARLRPELELLANLCMVSELTLRETPGESTLFARAHRSRHAKCERCWNLRQTVGTNSEHPTLCERCARVLTSLDR
jgi:isoleucyl-tRNA synthetase